MTRTAGIALATFGAITLLSLARCGGNPEVVHAPPYWADDASAPCDGGCPLDGSARRVGPSAAAVIEAVLRAAAEVTAEADFSPASISPEADCGVADSAPIVAPTRSIECDDDGCRVVPVRRLETLTRETEP